MPQTVTGTLYKKFLSIARNVATTHCPASAEVITFNHNLALTVSGRTPHYVWAVLRTVTTHGGIGGNSTPPAIPGLALRSFNLSQAIFDGVGVGAGWGSASPALALFDIFAQFVPAMQG